MLKIGTKNIMKNCEQCGKLMKEVNCSTKFCPDCKKIRRKIVCDNYYENSLKPKQQDKQEEYKSYFEELISKNNSPQYLTTKGFNTISKYNTYVYCNSFNISWLDWLKKYNKYNKLVNYILEEYSCFYDTTNSQDLKKFSRLHKFITIDILTSIGLDFIRDKCGVEKLRHNDEYYKINFDNIVDSIGHIPLYHEFENLSLIAIESYSSRFKLKGKVYDSIVKMYTSKDQFKEYEKSQQLHKSEVGKSTSTMNKDIISLEDLECEFRKVFDQCFSETNKYPSRRLFSKLSKYDDKTYRKKLNIGWSDVCKNYGYPTQRGTSIFENYVLKHMSKILNEDYISQKTFPWLKSINDSNLFCDGYFVMHNLIVEVDGRQHRKSSAKFGGEKNFKIQQANDAIKDKLIPRHGITLLRIADNTNWHDIKYLKARLEDVLHKQL